MILIEQLYQDFIKRLSQKTIEELMADIERAREESKNSHLIEDEDIVRVVRCKDCKYAHMTYNGDCKYCQIDIDRGYTDAAYRDGDWFCADGERWKE